jgi:ArsR family transcriptional regulator, arsenate/arsenite/antimonite-responsive transcriptional repressor
VEIMTSIPVVQACCAPISTSVLDQETAETLTSLLKVLADPARLQILSMLASAGGEVCVCDLTEPLGLSQPTVSHHMKQLREGGFVSSERRGKWIFYSLVPAQIRAVTDALAL